MKSKTGTRLSARWLSVLSGVLLSAAGCGSDGDGGTYCCVLRYLAKACTSSYNTAGLNRSVAEWEKVGTSGDGEACKALVDNGELGCYGSFGEHDESEAIATCSE